MSCIVHGCRSHSRNYRTSSEKITFHGFPKDEEIRRQWFPATGRSENQHKRYWKMCSKHFHSNCFLSGYSSRTYLKKNAVPTLNLPCEIKVELSSESFNNSQQQRRSPSVLVTNMIYPGAHVSEHNKKSNTAIPQKYHNGDSDSLDPLAITSTDLTETTTVNQSTLKAVYEGRIDKLQKRINKLEQIAKNRLLKLNAQKQRTIRLKKMNSKITQRLIELLENENR